MRTPAPAFLTSLGTLLTIMPEFSQLPNLAISGCICAGFFFLFVLAQWALVFARLEWGRILSLSGISFFVAALIAFAVAWTPLNAAAFITSLLPLVSFAFLRAIPGDSSPNAGCSFACSSRASSDPHCKPCDPAKMDGSPFAKGTASPPRTPCPGRRSQASSPYSSPTTASLPRAQWANPGWVMPACLSSYCPQRSPWRSSA